MAVGDLVTDHHEGILPKFFRPVQDVLHRDVVPHRADRDHALMRVGLAHGVELSPVAFHHRDALVLCHRGDKAQGPVTVPAGNIDLVDRSPGPQRLCDGISAFNQFVFNPVCMFHSVLRPPDPPYRIGE